MLKNVPYVDIDYCQFSHWGYQKPTRFWGSPNLGQLPHVKCPGRSCANVISEEKTVRHKEKLGGNAIKFGTVLKGRIPPMVIDYLTQEGEFFPHPSKNPTLNVRDKGYKFNPFLRSAIFEKFGVLPGQVQIDMFASQKDAQEKLFMTEFNSAWNYNWEEICPEGQILWANPPFEEIKKVITKACLEPCKLILVTPSWNKAGWKFLLEEIKEKEELVPAFFPVYERNSGKELLPGRHWATKITLINTTKVRVPKIKLDPILVREIESESNPYGWRN
jgi:hypothetical protein